MSKQTMEEVLKQNLINLKQDPDKCGIYELMGDMYPYLQKVGVFMIESIKVQHPDKNPEEINKLYLEKLKESSDIIIEMGKVLEKHNPSLAQTIMITTSMNFSALKKLTLVCSTQKKETEFTKFECTLCYKDCQQLEREAKHE